MCKEAILYKKKADAFVQCVLCAHQCKIGPGKRGACGIRENRGGKLYSLVYGRLVAGNVDHIEKKPLFHFQPGSMSYSIATAGCNMSCLHCQNYQISKEAVNVSPISGTVTTSEQVVATALDTGCRSISYTYTEPVIFMEFAMDCASLGTGKGLANVFVTNGFMTTESAGLASQFLDAANIDLKGATDDHYREVCGARLQPVLDTIEKLHASSVWIEVTTLVIPGLNDDRRSFQFIASFLASVDPSIPWHLSRFFPTYRMLDRPPTPFETLKEAEKIGKDAGLKYIYLGNVPQEKDITCCPHCGHILLERSGYTVVRNRITEGGNCSKCGAGFDGRV
jgi:pyruvate formate lyase activating enzyme